MTLRHRLLGLFLFLLYSSPVLASEESSPAQFPDSAKTGLSASAPQKTEEERENDIWKNGKKDTIDAGKLFGKIIQHLWDTYEIHLIGTTIPLPIIFTDAYGFHFFSSVEKLEESGVYRFKDPGK